MDEKWQQSGGAVWRWRVQPDHAFSVGRWQEDSIQLLRSKRLVHFHNLVPRYVTVHVVDDTIGVHR